MMRRFLMLLALMGTSVVFGACQMNINLLGGASAELQEAVVDGDEEDDQKILLINVEGTITSEDSRSLLGGSPNSVESLRWQLDKARSDGSIKALLLRINSPGGGATASDTMLEDLRRFKSEKKIPVVAFFQDTAASGGYYVSMVADEIIAQPTTITGSIGVIYVSMDVTEMLEDLGVKAHVVKSGDLKGGNNPLVKRNPEHIAAIERLINQMHIRFVDQVESGRTKMTREEIRKLANGGVYMGKEAKELGLVDELGFLDDAIKRTRELAGAKGASVVTYTTRPQRANTLYSNPGADQGEQPLNLKIVDDSGMLAAGPRFLYLYSE